MGRASRSKKAGKPRQDARKTNAKGDKAGDLSWSTKIQLGVGALLLGTLFLLISNMMSQPDSLARADDDAAAPAEQSATETPASSADGDGERTPPKPSQQADSRPPVRLDPPRLTFTGLEPNESVTGRTRIHNEGSEPLRVRHSSASCGCTAIDLAGTYILPGDSETLSVEYDAPEEGSRSSTVRIIFDNYREPVTLNVQGTVGP